MPDEDQIALEKAWRLHDVQVQWTGQVDSKASFVLAVSTGIIVGVITLAGDGHRLSKLDDTWTKLYFVIGVALLVFGLVAVAFAVRPRLRNPSIKAEARDDYIYFGHARFWNAEELANRLTQADMLPVVTRQVVRMAEIAWRKHRYLEVSITSSLIGTLFIGLAAWTN